MKISKKQLALMALLATAPAIFAMEDGNEENVFAQRARSLTPAGQRVRSASPNLEESEMGASSRSRQRIISESVVEPFIEEVNALKAEYADKLASEIDKKEQMQLLISYLRKLSFKIKNLQMPVSDLPKAVENTILDAKTLYDNWEAKNRLLATSRGTRTGIDLAEEVRGLNQLLQ